jgi:uncharacterized membrane protein
VILRLVFITVVVSISIPSPWCNLLGIWAIYRVARGWLALREGRILPSGGL